MLVKQLQVVQLHNELIRQCIRGNRLSQNELYRLFAPAMFGVCLCYARNREDAEEILQEGFYQVFKSLEAFRNDGPLEGWMRKIMVRSAIHRFRSQSKVRVLPLIEKTEITAWEEADAPAILNQKEMLKMVQGLPPVYRMVFNLFVFEGMKHREIAEQLGISEGTSKSNLFDAKLILQKAINNSVKMAR